MDEEMFWKMEDQLKRIRELSDESAEYDGRGRIYVYAEDLDKILDE